MRIPISYYVTCPCCGCSAGIKITDAHNYWLDDSTWKCSRCKGYSTTAEVQNATKDKNETNN